MNGSYPHLYYTDFFIARWWMTLLAMIKNNHLLPPPQVRSRATVTVPVHESYFTPSQWFIYFCYAHTVRVPDNPQPSSADVKVSYITLCLVWHKNSTTAYCSLLQSILQLRKHLQCSICSKYKRHECTIPAPCLQSCDGHATMVPGRAVWSGPILSTPASRPGPY